MRTARRAVIAALVLVAACGDDDAPVIDAAVAIDAAGVRPAPGENWDRDILATDLALDLGDLTGTAVVTLAPDTSGTASFDVGDLSVTAVRDVDGPLRYAQTGDRLDVGVVDDGATPATVAVDYAFSEHTAFDGYLARDLTFLWPTHCGNLFPCKPEPDDGLAFTLDVTGLDGGDTAVYPASIPGDAPSYMPAIAVGDYTYVELGTTAAGTTVGVWHLPGDSLAGVDGLDEIFDWLERTYGAYIYGDDVATVSADWGGGAFGGMEHHPYWHVARAAMADRETNAHEAAHGWFGNAVRIACWEDFALSEGTVSYLAARAIEQVHGAADGDAVWASYDSRLCNAIGAGDTVALPDATCNEIDLLVHPLWSSIPYMKGAFFWRAVEQKVGRAELDAALAAFYRDRAGTAARMRQLIDFVESETGADLSAEETGWLRSAGRPDKTCP